MKELNFGKHISTSSATCLAIKNPNSCRDDFQKNKTTLTRLNTKAYNKKHLMKDKLSLTSTNYKSLLKNMKDKDYLSLEKIAKNYAARYGHVFEADELLHRAIVTGLDRAVKREKHCKPPTVANPFAYLCVIMRSICTTKIKSRKDTTGNIDILRQPDDKDPLQIAIRDEELEIIHAMFNGNILAQHLIMALIEGDSPKEIQTALKISKTTYNSLRRLIKRQFNKPYLG